MKKLIFITTCLLCNIIVRAQLFYDANGNPVNIRQIERAYKTTVQPYVQRNKEQEATHEKNIAKGKDIDEGGDYQFDRWLWYWKQHTDVNGNMVSTSKIWDEWQKYQAKNNLRNARVTSTNTSNWKFQGPDTPFSQDPSSGIGRISAIGFHPTNPNTYWIGSDGGGAWKTTNNGASWTCMTDNMPSIVVSDVDINPMNPNTVYICTGDRDHGGWDNHLDLAVGYGLGVFKSYNGGATWDTTGMKWNASALEIANCLVINPKDTNCIQLATNKGIFKSMNGGATWTQTATGNFKQLLYSAIDTSVIFASKYASAASGQVYRSKDNGNTWTQVSSFVNVLRIGLAVTPANPSVVKALTSSSDASGNLYGIEGVYTSSDTGKTFSQVYYGSCSNNILDWTPTSSHTCGGQGQYDLMIAIDPTNANNVYIGGINAWYSNDGGYNWNNLTQWTDYGVGTPVVHADKHVAIFHPLVPNRFFECNDGGIYTVDDMFLGGTWNNISTGLGITEFYSNAISPITRAVVGGAQDNSTMFIEDHSMGILSGGDGMQCQQDPTDSNTIYTSYVYGVIYSFTNLYTGYSYNIISNNISTPAPVGPWLTPFVLQAKNNFGIIAGYDQIYFSPDQGNSWSSISPVFFPGRYIGSIGITNADSQTIYAVSADTNVINYTFNLGTTWSKIVADAGTISNIEVDPRNRTHFWITYSGFGANKVEEYKPIIGWKKLNNGLPDVPINCIRIDSAKRILYVGTDLGVFYKSDTGSLWQPYNNGLPVVRISQLNVNYTTKQLWAATYGRGMWSSPTSDSVLAIKYVNPLAIENNTIISPNPNQGSFNLITDSYFGNKRVDICLTDNTGRTVFSNALRFDENGKVLIQTSGLAKGIYFLEAACENNVIASKKVVME